MRDRPAPPYCRRTMQTEREQQAPPSSSKWARIGAVLYDPFVWVAELAGMRRSRRALLAQASGRVLEIGAGTGLNLSHYLDEIDELVLVEPEPAMREQLTQRIRRAGSRAAVVDAPAEALPFADGSFDTVVCTLVLCTVSAPDGALGEIGRVLRPDGQLLFIEHVRAESPTLAYLQDRLREPWRRFACGCRCDRATVELMRSCGFQVHARQSYWHAMPPIVRPLVSGRATYEGETHA
jgi:ubiquinone/menaquinone biosynthesis C-methylase UbiE